jgi:hypothetical protein
MGVPNALNVTKANGRTTVPCAKTVLSVRIGVHWTHALRVREIRIEIRLQELAVYRARAARMEPLRLATLVLQPKINAPTAQVGRTSTRRMLGVVSHATSVSFQAVKVKWINVKCAQLENSATPKALNGATHVDVGRHPT